MKQSKAPLEQSEIVKSLNNGVKKKLNNLYKSTLFAHKKMTEKKDL